MASLAQTTEITRSILKWIGILLVVFLVFQWIIIPLGKVIYNSFTPKKIDVPTVAFGKLPPIPFPKTNGNYPTTFSIQTTTGSLPPTCQPTQAPCTQSDLPNKIAVYKFITPVQSLSSLDDAIQKAQAVGFSGDANSLTPIVYQWIDSTNPQRSLTLNIVTNSFDLTTNVPPDNPPPFSPNATDAKGAAVGFLSSMNLLETDLSQDPQVTFLTIKNGRLFTGTSLSEANYAQVDFQRDNINQLQVKNPDASHSIITFLVTQGQNSRAFVQEAHFSYKAVDMNSSATYPIKTAMQAYQELQQGNGYIAQAPATNAQIQNVYLAYFEGKDPDQQYLYPIFVFEGDGFEAYVPAITSDWIIPQAVTQP